MEKDNIENEWNTGKRFTFGNNWKNYISNLSEKKIQEAKRSLTDMLACNSLEGKSFLDAGCGSGLFSLVAHQLGANVHSFDYDPESVGCTQELKNCYVEHSNNYWTVEQGSILDEDYLSKLDKYDVVYSWGVLHHTGNMWEAMGLITKHVKNNGVLFIALYNDCGKLCDKWLKIKRYYCSAPNSIKKTLVLWLLLKTWGLKMIKDLVTKGNPLSRWNKYIKNRGMSPWYDIIDWIGGYPYEYTSPQKVIQYYKKQGFTLVNIKTNCGYGNNEFVFIKDGCSNNSR